MNEETANRRPIMLALPTKEERETKEAVVKEAENTDTKKTASGEEKSKCAESRWFLGGQQDLDFV